MRNAFALFALVASIAELIGAASAAPALDANGKRRDGGKFVAQSMCMTPPPAGQKCRDKVTKKFTKCGALGSEPVPAVSAKQKP